MSIYEYSKNPMLASLLVLAVMNNDVHEYGLEIL